MNLPHHTYQLGIRFGFPSSEKGTGFNETTSCRYYEALQYSRTNSERVEYENGDLDEESFVSWFEKGNRVQHTKTGSNAAEETFVGGLRLLYGNCAFNLTTKNRSLPFSETHFNYLTKHLQLPAQFLPAMRVWTCCAFKFQCSPGNNDFNPAYCYVFKTSIFQIGHYHMALSYSPTRNLTHAILLHKPFHEPASAFSFTGLLKNLNASQISIHPLLLPVLLAELSMNVSDERFLWVDEEIHELEQATGQHRWADRVLGDPMVLDYTSATKTLNFVSRSMAVETMRVKEHLLTFAFILKEIDLLATLGPADVKEKGARLREIVNYHVNKCENFLLRAEFQEKKVHALIAVVYQFMTQKDSKVNIELAEMTALIARESKKDSSAMKAIAVLTMCFLPGTFLATLFAMPVFNWDEPNGPIIKKAFRYYFAIALPLTFCVLLIWAASMWLPWTKWMARVQTVKENRRADIEMADIERWKSE